MTDTGLVAQMQATAATIEDLSTGGAPSGKRAWVVVVAAAAAVAAAADSKSCLCTCGVAVAAAAASLVDWHVWGHLRIWKGMLWKLHLNSSNLFKQFANLSNHSGFSGEESHQRCCWRCWGRQSRPLNQSSVDLDFSRELYWQEAADDNFWLIWRRGLGPSSYTLSPLGVRTTFNVSCVHKLRFPENGTTKHM